MQALGNILQLRQKSLSETARTIWPVWHNSIRTPVAFTPKSKREALKLWYRAKRWDQRTHEKFRHGGIVGRSALAVLHVLITDFLNFRTGRLDPAIATIAKAARVCERTAATALARLRDLGIIGWLRRCEESTDEHGRFILRQRTNAYSIIDAKSWIGDDEPDPPAPSRDELGLSAHRHTAIEAAAEQVAAKNPSGMLADLRADPNDALALAFASFLEAIQAREGTASPAMKPA